MHTPTPILAPSILAADYTQLGDQIRQCVEAGASWIHSDVMDGHFVPNISYGPLIVDAANRATDVFMDVHLMIYNPDQYAEAFVKAGADLISVHIEATPHIHRSVQMIKNLGIKAGVAINPATSLHQIEAILPEVDLVVLMSVNPGFGGQKFIENTFARIEKLVQLRQSLNAQFLIEIDGGVGEANAEALVKKGADVLVAGNSIFSAPDIPARVKSLLSKIGAI